MLKNVSFIIQARTGSTRLPGKMTKPFYGTKNLLQILIERLQYHFPAHQIILATSYCKDDQILLNIAKSYNIKSFAGSEADVLDRFVETASRFNCDTIVRICADNPFLHAGYLKDMLTSFALLKNADYYSYEVIPGLPVIKSHLGLFAEITSRQALEKVSSLTKDAIYREHVTNYLYSHPQVFRCYFLHLPEILRDFTNLRFTVDTQEDFDLQQQLYTAVTTGFDYNLDKLLSLTKQGNVFRTMQEQIERNSK